jgi:hypothetical protein
MDATRKVSKFDLANLVDPSGKGPTGTRRIGAFDLEPAESGQRTVATAAPEPIESEAPVATGDRLTPVDMPMSRDDSTTISIPPAAVEIATPRALSAHRAKPASDARQERQPSNPSEEERPASVDARALKTQLAQRFSTLADNVNERFVNFHIGAGRWGLELSTPDGMSTANGKQSLQHLRMRPRREGYPVLLAGMVNSVERTAELRDYAHITSVHVARFGRPLEIAAPEWEQLLRRCEVALKLAKIDAVRTPPGPEVRGSSHRFPRKLVVAAALLIISVVALALATRALLGP